MDGFGFAVACDRRWYAVRAQPKKEHLAELHLHRQGFRPFLPKIPKVVRYPTRTETLSVPFFPGYLFVNLSLAQDRWRSVNGTIGVQNIVTFGDRPAPAPAGLIEALLAGASPNGEINLDETFERGNHVRVVGGPFDGHIGTFEGMADGDRVTILLRMLAREVAVRIAKTAIMAA